ncbi:hypothetical protein [Maribacter aestuarii]|uniref:hypothetical protein n=1 Tax=Maribacter aestuarii TaxID=1130723 RepID=UPI00248BC911|nr:hypothetical protein [Maribacter aestuarii]
MNTTTSNPKTELLLGASLEVLHQESQEWQETIAFWKDETKFFANLLSNKEISASEFGQMLKNLDKIHENLFDYLSDDIISHEKLLSRLMKGEKGLSDSKYREQHRKLNDRMELFAKNFKEFKKMVFGYARKL